MASADYRVFTPERVSLQYDIAGVGSRGAAAVVDTLLQSIALTVAGVAFFAATAASGLFEGRFGGTGGLTPSLLLGLFILAVFCVTNGYFIVFEILWSGQTPGKRLVGVRVMRESGYPIRPVDAVIRNLVRVVDWLPVIYGVGVLTMLLNKRSKRLGDFASGTIVVREGGRGVAAVLMPPVSSATLSSESRGVTLSATDATLVRDFLVRRGVMHPRSRAELAARIATAVSRRYGLPFDGDAERFLETLSA